tara:strand:+ start:674 stop:1234 length:561 start_codon:yes stop_codon:yes gene_type:complete
MNKRPLVFFDVPGEPRGKGRHRDAPVWLKGGKLKTVWKKTKQGLREFPVMTRYTDEKTRAYEGLVIKIAKLVMRAKESTRFPVAVDITIRVPITPSWPQWKKEAALNDLLMPTDKPDDDNVVKAIKDGLNEVVYHDDCQSVSLNVQKIFDVNPGVGVEVYEVLAVPCQVKTKAELNKFLEFIRAIN